MYNYCCCCCCNNRNSTLISIYVCTLDRCKIFFYCVFQSDIIIIIVCGGCLFEIQFKSMSRRIECHSIDRQKRQRVQISVARLVYYITCFLFRRAHRTDIIIIIYYVLSGTSIVYSCSLYRSLVVFPCCLIESKTFRAHNIIMTCVALDDINNNNNCLLLFRTCQTIRGLRWPRLVVHSYVLYYTFVATTMLYVRFSVSGIRRLCT